MIDIKGYRKVMSIKLILSGILFSLSVFTVSFNAMALDMVMLSDIGSYTVNVVSFKETRFKTVFKQKYDFSCGSAALASLLTFHYEYPVSELDVFKEMYRQGDKDKIQKEGFSLLDMKKYLGDNGYNADGFRTTLDKLSQVGIPAITLINNGGYMHFVLIKGVSDQQVLVGDPSLGVKPMPRGEFESMWQQGILFLIRNRADIAKAYFNQEEEWNSLGKAPLDMGTALSSRSLADFNLLLPAQSDFK